MIGQRTAASDRARVAGEEEGDLILRLFDQLLDGWNDLRSTMHQLLALSYIEKGAQTAAFTISDEGQRVLAYGQRPTRDSRALRRARAG